MDKHANVLHVSNANTVLLEVSIKMISGRSKCTCQFLDIFISIFILFLLSCISVFTCFYLFLFISVLFVVFIVGQKLSSLCLYIVKFSPTQNKIYFDFDFTLTLILCGKMPFLLLSENEFFHIIKCKGMTSFMEFMS